jgi:hypothetical protein
MLFCVDKNISACHVMNVLKQVMKLLKLGKNKRNHLMELTRAKLRIIETFNLKW